jgi:adenine phosphoribosyltransferase
MLDARVERLRKLVRDVPDFPKPGILFRDLTPLFQDPQGLREAVESVADPFRGAEIDAVVGIESRGFILGTPLAMELDVGFVLVRKAGKLPPETLRVSYDLEYGSDTVEMSANALGPNQRVLVVDDLIATGGTAAAAIELVRKSGAEVVGCSFLIELAALEGRKRLQVDRIHASLVY